LSGFLLDTNTALFALAGPEKLSGEAHAAILAGPNHLSVLTYWEVLLKSMKGKLDVGDPRRWWTDALDQLAAVPLLLRPEHVAGIFTLGAHHQDPFDRALIAQAIAEGLTLISSDNEIARNAADGLQTIG
jgi:PIN domain nuclease of toxin-antitoxin system